MTESGDLCHGYTLVRKHFSRHPNWSKRLSHYTHGSSWNMLKSMIMCSFVKLSADRHLIFELSGHTTRCWYKAGLDGFESGSSKYLRSCFASHVPFSFTNLAGAWRASISFNFFLQSLCWFLCAFRRFHHGTQLNACRYSVQLKVSEVKAGVSRFKGLPFETTPSIPAAKLELSLRESSYWIQATTETTQMDSDWESYGVRRNCVIV